MTIRRAYLFVVLLILLGILGNVTLATSPAIDYSTATPPDNTSTQLTNFKLNFTIDESNLTQLIYHWNGTNYTLYNRSLSLLINLDNATALGDNATHIKDISTFQYNGTATGGAVWNATGKYGGAYSFNGKGGIFTYRSFMSQSSQFTMAGWVYAGATGSRIALWGQNDAVEFGFIDSDSLMIWTANGGNIDWTINSTIFPLNSWNYVVTVATNVSSPYLSLYINGILRATGGSAPGSNFGSSVYNFSIASGVFDPTEGNFTGSIDEVIVINRSLSPTEVYQLYASNLKKNDSTKWLLSVNQSKNTTHVLEQGNYTYYAAATNSQGSNLTSQRIITVDTTPATVSYVTPTAVNNSALNKNHSFVNLSTSDLNRHYSFVDFDKSLRLWLRFETLNSTGSPIDSSYNTNVSNSSTTTTVFGHWGQAYDFGDYRFLTLPRPVQDDFTICAWIKTRAVGGSLNHWLSAPILESEVAFANNDFGFGIGAGGFPILGNGDSTVDRTINATFNVSDNYWHHVCGVRVKSNGTQSIYVDGIRNVSGPGGTASLTGNTEAMIGFGTDGGSYLNGTMDELLVWNRTLTAEEILSLYDSSANRYSNNFAGIADGNHTWRAYVVDAAGNSNSTFMTITIDRTVPLWSGNKTNITSSSSGQIYFNITFNDSNAADYIFSFYNGSIWINQTAAYVSGTEIQVIKNITTVSGDINWTWYVNDSIGNLNQTSLWGALIDTVDTDSDGILDSSDPLLFNETFVNVSGISQLNITVAGNSTNGSFTGVQEVVFYDGSSLIVNFSHNFSQSSLNLQNISINKTTTALIVNFSGQLQGNKTLYITDDSFAALCVKDDHVNSINDISAACTGANETNFATCIGTSVRINAINCTDLGTSFKIENLRYSAIRGTQSSSSSGSSSSGGGGGSSSASKSIKLAEAKGSFECQENADCGQSYSCFENQCVKFFDVKILRFDSPVDANGFLQFTYYVKGMSVINADVLIRFWLEGDNEIISSGSDVIYFGEYDEKTEETQIYIPKNIANGIYDFYVRAEYGTSQATAHRTVFVERKDETIVVALEDKQEKNGDLKQRILLGIGLLFIVVTCAFFMFRYKLSATKRTASNNLQKSKIDSKVNTQNERMLLTQGLIKEVLKRKPQKHHIPRNDSRKLVQGLLKEVLSKPQTARKEE